MLAGCGTLKDPPAASRAGDIELPMAVPATFTTGAIWETTHAAQATVAVTALGIVTLAETSKPDTYSPVLIAPDTGKPRWTGEGVRASKDEIPTLAWVEEGDRPWVVLTVADRTANTTTVYAFDGLASHEDSPPTSTKVFTGATPEALPSVAISDTGIMVSRSTEGGYLQYHPDSGAITALGTAPTRGGVAGTPLLVSDDGWLVTYDGIGFGYATTAGGWESDKNIPTGANAGGERVLQVGSGYVVSLWGGTDEGTRVLALQDLQSGNVTATIPVDEQDEHTLLDEQIASDAAPHHLVSDSEWVTWGAFAFNNAQESGETISIAGGNPVSIIQGMVYVEGAERPLTGPDSTPEPTPTPTATPGAEPSPLPTASATPERIKGFSGYVALDLASGTPMPTAFESAPLGISSYGQGIFANEDAIYAVPLR